MSTQGQPAKADSGKDAASRLRSAVRTAPSPRPALSPRHDPLLQKRYRELTRKHLNGLVHRLFADLTGLHFHIAWAPSLPHDWTAVTLPTGCAVCRRLAGTGDGTDKDCRTCGPKHLARTLRARNKGHQFTCRLGVRNHWFPINVRGVTVGIAYLQALAGNRSRARVRRNVGRSRVKVVARSDFRRGGRLLHLMVQYVQTLDLAELRMADLASARHAVTALENEQARLRKELGRVIPATAGTPAAAGPENHTERVARAALAIVHQQYAQPLTLKRCARNLGLNATYLSALFSRVVGIPFKSYLTELRLQKARELLGNPKTRVSEVAGAVGYASDNRFRNAFRKATGFSPRTWRETFHAAGPFFLTSVPG